MIYGWIKRDAYWMNISFPGFDREREYRGYLVTRKHVLSVLRGVKKNCMRLLRHRTFQLLRQDSATDTGSVLWGCQDLSGSGRPTGSVQEVWKSETGETAVAGKQSLLYESVFLLCGPEVSNNDHQGCSHRVETGLAHGQGLGQRVHAGTVAAQSSGSAQGNRDRRDIFAEGAHLSDCDKRP